jgi:hypothetical protein
LENFTLQVTSPVALTVWVGDAANTLGNASAAAENTNSAASINDSKRFNLFIFHAA